jgi:dienelactone hydrolase
VGKGLGESMPGQKTLYSGAFPFSVFVPQLLMTILPIRCLPTVISLLLIVLLLLTKNCHAAPSPGEALFQDVTLPSTAPSGDPRNDLIRFRLYFASAGARFGSPAPTVIVVPQTGSDYKGSAVIRHFGEYLAQQGLNAAIITLPYHGERKQPKVVSSVRFFGGTPARNAQAFDQSGADVVRLVDWLRNESPPTVDKKRIGIVGISLGAIVAHLAMGRDPRITVGVAALGSGDLADLYHSSLLVKILHRQHPVPPLKSEDDFIPLRGADPLTYADRNRPRNVLMIQAARDQFIPPRDATRLWHALGEPPIRWLDINHLALSLVPDKLMRAAFSWFEQTWASDAAPDKYRVPDISVPTIKTGAIATIGGDGHVVVTPALQWQFFTLAKRRDHLSLLHLDSAITTRGLLVGGGVTVTPFIDVGLMSRLSLTKSPSSLRPYVSFHLVY